MLNYQSTSYHDALYVREVLGLKPAPEFLDWLTRLGILDDGGRIRDPRLTTDVSERLLSYSEAGR
jgi:ethanolamine ammonia-lyase large subunit